MKRFLLWLLCGYAVMGQATTLTALTIQQDEHSASVHASLSGPFQYHVFTLSHPERVVIDLPNITTRLNVASGLRGRGFIMHVRSGHPTPNTLRLVLDTTAAVSCHVTRTHANNMQIDIRQISGKPLERINSSASSSTSTPVLSKPVLSTRQPKGRLRDVVIVLDPGHGGSDPGAIGPSSRYVEKRVVLAIAMRLKQLIDKQPGMRAVLTRDGDYYVGLRQRLMIARKHNADVFISIHADAYINQQSHGASVFALSARGATSEAARWLAEKENYSELGGVNLKSLDDKNGLIRTVLLDLSQTATITESLQLGTQILRDLDHMTSLHNHRVEQARFVVLKSPDTPSVLVETGFISNPMEAKRLVDVRYQTQLSQAIFAGLKRYFHVYPPHGTHLEAMLAPL